MMKKGKTQKNDDEKDWINVRRIKQLQIQLTKESCSHIEIQTLYMTVVESDWALLCYIVDYLMLIDFL